VKKSATVFTNDPQNPRHVLVLQGNIKALVEVRPNNNITFRGLAEQQPEKTVEFLSTSRPFSIEKVESNLEDKISYKIETVAEGKHYRLKIANLLKHGNYNGFVKCFTNVPEKPEIQVRVNAYIEGDISVKPLTVLVGKLSAQQPVRTGKVLVVSNRNKPFQIKKLTYDEKLIQIKQEPLAKEPGFSLEITPCMENLAPGTEGRQQTTLSILTDVPSDEPQNVQIHIINSSGGPPAVPPPPAQQPPPVVDDEEAAQ